MKSLCRFPHLAYLVLLLLAALLNESRGTLLEAPVCTAEREARFRYVPRCPYYSLPGVTNGWIDESSCSGYLLDDICKITCNTGLSPTYVTQTICQSDGGKLGDWYTPPNGFQCKDHWSDTFIGCIRNANNRTVYDVEDIAACGELCLKETGFTCSSVDFRSSNGRCNLSKYNRNTVPDTSTGFVQPCFNEGDGWSFRERVDVGNWSEEVPANVCEYGYRPEPFLVREAMDFETCKMACSQTERCCSVLFRDEEGECEMRVTSIAPLFTSCENPNWHYAQQLLSC